MKILVLGASGQLGNCIAKVAAEKNIIDISFPLETQGNILNFDLLRELFEKEKPEFAINCAAYTAVDKAEDEREISRKVNRDGAENIAKCCLEHNTTMIHVSTDFVFKGDVPKLLTENDDTDPINVYGLTKLEGEAAIAGIIEKNITIRTSWLYSEFGNNFVKTMLRLGKEREQLGVVADQIGTPTYAIDLATAILDIIEQDTTHYGIYHYSNEGVTSWYDFAKGIFDISETSVLLKPVKTSEYPTKAVRPAFSVMDKSKIKATFGLNIPYWRDSLEICIGRLNA